MKRIFRNIVVHVAGLYFVSILVQGLSFPRGILSIIITGAFMSITAFIIKPVVNILLLPLNLVTFNFFRWVGNLATLYIASLVLSNDFRVGEFNFPGYSSTLLDIPHFSLNQGVLSYIAFAFVVSFFVGALHWLVSEH